MTFIFPRDVLAAPHAIYDAIFVVMILLIVAARPRLDRLVLAYASIVGVGLVLFMAVGSMAGVLVYARHEVVLFFPLLALAMLVLQRLTGSIAPFARVAFVATYVGLALGTDDKFFGHGTREGDYLRVARYLDRHATANDVIAVFGPEQEMPLARSYHGAAQIHPLPRPASLERYDYATLVLHDEREAERAVAPSALDRRRVWLMTTSGCEADGCEYLQRAVERDYHVVSIQRFYGAIVQELVPDPGR